MTDKALVERQTGARLVETYAAAARKVEEGFELLAQAERELKAAGLLGRYKGVFHDGRRALDVSDLVETSRAHLLRSAWEFVVSRLDFRNMLSLAKQERLDEQLSSGELPPFTLENIAAFLDEFSKSYDSVIEEAVREVYDHFRPTTSWANHYKTNENNRYGFGSKLIVTGAMTGYGVSVYAQKWLRALDRAFHLLDGKGVPKYPGDLVTRISDAQRRREKAAETPYFSAKWFKNGNLHITFRRADLLEMFNRIGGGARLKAA